MHILQGVLCACSMEPVNMCMGVFGELSMPSGGVPCASPFI